MGYVVTAIVCAWLGFALGAWWARGPGKDAAERHFKRRYWWKE